MDARRGAVRSRYRRAQWEFRHGAALAVPGRTERRRHRRARYRPPAAPPARLQRQMVAVGGRQPPRYAADRCIVGCGNAAVAPEALYRRPIAVAAAAHPAVHLRAQRAARRTGGRVRHGVAAPPRPDRRGFRLFRYRPAVHALSRAGGERDHDRSGGLCARSAEPGLWPLSGARDRADHQPARRAAHDGCLCAGPDQPDRSVAGPCRRPLRRLSAPRRQPADQHAGSAQAEPIQPAGRNRL